MISRETSAIQEGTEPEQEQARLVEAEAPKHPTGLIPRVCCEIPMGAGVEQVHEVRVVGLSGIMDDLANQQMKIQLAPEGT
jgi:hypothetical protein